MCPPNQSAPSTACGSPHIRWKDFQKRFDVEGSLQQRHPELRALVEAGDEQKAIFRLGWIRGVDHERQRRLERSGTLKPARTLATGGTPSEVAIARFLFELAGESADHPPVSSEVHLPHRLASKPWAVPVIVSALPHVEPESVAANYMHARRTLLESFKGKVSVRRIVMVDFIKEEERRQDTPLTGSERLKRWNSIAPAVWQYGDRREMAREYRHEMNSARNRYQVDSYGNRGRPYRGFVWEDDDEWLDGDVPPDDDSDDFEEPAEDDSDDFDVPELR